MSDLFREIPRIAVVLQRALRKAAPTRSALASGRLDEATLADTGCFRHADGKPLPW